MKRSATRAMLAALLALAGCADDGAEATNGDGGVDATPDTKAADGGADTGGPDIGAPADAVTDTTVADTAVADTTGDATEDTTQDVTLEDVPASPDAQADVADTPMAPDAAPDTTDAGPADTATPDTADATAPPDEPHPLFDYWSWIRIRETYNDGFGLSQSGVEVRINDAPYINAYTLLADEGACRYYQWESPPPCEPACEPWSEYCDIDGACKPMPSRVSAGTLAITGLAEPVQAIPDETAFYGVVPSNLPDDLFAPGATVTVTATGATVPGFSATVSGVADMELGHSPTLDMVDGQPLVVTWVPKGDGARIELVIQIGWHGKPPTDILFCEGEDADGAITVPAALVEAYPPAGGIGLFQNPSWIRRVSRATVDAGAGPLEMSVSSEQMVNPMHNPW